MQFVAKIVASARAGKLCGLKFAGREIYVGKTNWRTGRVRGHGGEKIIFASVEDRDIGRRSGCDDPDDFATHDFLSGARLLHLIANGDLESGANEAGDVALGRVIWDAAHRNGLAFFAIPRGQHDLQFAGREDGVFVEEFVEIAQAEQEQCVGVARFDCLVLLHQRCGGIGHFEYSE